MESNLVPGRSSPSISSEDHDFDSLIVQRMAALTANGQDGDPVDRRVVQLQEVLKSIDGLLTCHEQTNVEDVVQRHPQLGQALTVAAYETRRHGSRPEHDLLLRSLRRFHRPGSRDPVQVALTRQSQRLIRSLVMFPEECVSDGNLAVYRNVLASTPLTYLVSSLQAQLSEHLHAVSVGEESFESLCRLCTVVLDDSVRADSDLLEAVVRRLPPANSERVVVGDGALDFYKTLGRAISRDAARFPDSLLVSLAEKDTNFFERQILSLFASFTRGAEHTMEGNTWLISCVATNRKMFQNLNSLLHSLLVKLDYHFEARLFVKEMLTRIRQVTPLDNLYPQSLASVFVLLGVRLEGLPCAAIERIALMTVEAALGGLFEQTVTIFEVAVLSCHFSEWWIHIQLLSTHSDSKVRFKYHLLENLLFGTRLIDC